MARPHWQTSLKLEGPFFQRDPVKTFRQNVRDFLDEVVAAGEEDVKAQLRQGEGGRMPIRGVTPARVSGHVTGRTKNLSGKRWAVTGVVSVLPKTSEKKKAIAIMAAASRIEGREHIFRRTTSRLRRVKADLLKGLT